MREDLVVRDQVAVVGSGVAGLTAAKRYDPDGAYVRRWVPELARLAAPAIHEPWKLPAALRAELDYPPPLVALDVARDRFRSHRGLA